MCPCRVVNKTYCEIDCSVRPRWNLTLLRERSTTYLDSISYKICQIIYYISAPWRHIRYLYYRKLTQVRDGKMHTNVRQTDKKMNFRSRSSKLFYHEHEDAKVHRNIGNIIHTYAVLLYKKTGFTINKIYEKKLEHGCRTLLHIFIRVWKSRSDIFRKI